MVLGHRLGLGIPYTSPVEVVSSVLPPTLVVGGFCLSDLVSGDLW
jgi:hypothetical protein